MDLRQIDLVMESHAKVEGDLVVIDRFYALLFEADPSARALFADLPSTRLKFCDELGVIVRSLTDLEGLEARTRALGASHRSYGVTLQHFDAAREALVTALSERLGDDFSDEAAEAWRRAFNLVAETMMGS